MPPIRDRLCCLTIGTALLCAGPGTALRADEDEAALPEGPDFKEILSLRGVGGPRIAPDGSAVVYSVRSADWEENRYDSELWLARGEQEPFQLTRTAKGSSSSPRWSPDGAWIAFLADRGDGTQIWLIRPGGGEARPLTEVEDGVGGFEWSPDAKRMAVTITDARDDAREEIEEEFGRFAVEDAEFRMSHLWILDVEAALAAEGPAKLPANEDEKDGPGDGDGTATSKQSGERDDDGEDEATSPFRRLTSGDTFTVNGYAWSPDGKRIAFSRRPDTRIESFSHSDLSVVDVEAGEVTALVERPGPDGSPIWSPDGRWILFETADGELAYYKNRYLAKIRADGGEPVLLTGGFDENPSVSAWLTDGIRFRAWDRTHRRLYRMDAAGRSIRPVEGLPRYVWSAHFSADGRSMAIDGGAPDRLDEIYRSTADGGALRRLTGTTEQTEGWKVGGRELLTWTSEDGASIEGVLLTPEGFDRSRKHPLLVIIHGGPAGISAPRHVYGSVYPVQQWLAKGAVILMPNYRGSAGYGEAFRSLNVRNLGVGDAWDVISGVDHLIERGFVDPERMGAMGWSQGGYISAFLTTTSDRFRAVSVGAGISNWMTYYVNTDIHPFTRHYLQATPWSDPEIYARTSPMTYITDASTPTLIQHGEFDRRVPTPNAYELFQGLRDVGVETELIIYKDFGHGIGKPKERLAALWHNWAWFARLVWGEEVEVPVE